ncbi:ubiquinol-cytochrome c reductase iron-sulfur subunit [soil metagenome]
MVEVINRHPAVEPGSDAGGGHQSRRDFIHIAAVAMAGGGVAAVAWPLVNQMNPAADTLALGSIEVDIGKVVEGQQLVVKWRGRPVFVRHRTAKEIAEAVNVKLSDLKDPATDASRTKAGHAEYLIVVGVCTHLGCVPNFGTGEYGGWFCPCHGSVYYTSARIRKGPAPKNLEVPEYAFTGPTKVKIG